MTNIEDEEKICKTEEDCMMKEMSGESHELMFEKEKIENNDVGSFSQSLRVEQGWKEQDQRNSLVQNKEILEHGSRIQDLLCKTSSQIRDMAEGQIRKQTQIKSIRIQTERRQIEETDGQDIQQNESQRGKDLEEQIEEEKCIMVVGEVIDIWDQDTVERIEGLTKITIETELYIDQEEQSNKSVNLQQIEQADDEIVVSREPQEAIVSKQRSQEVVVSHEASLADSPSSQLPVQFTNPLLLPSPNKFSSNIISYQPDPVLQQQFQATFPHQQASNPSSQAPQILPESQPQISSDYRPKKSLIQMLYFQQEPTISISNEPDFNPLIVVSQPQDTIPEISSQHIQKVSQQVSEHFYPELSYPAFETQIIVPTQSTPLSASFSILASPARNKQTDNPIITSSFDAQHSSTPLTLASFPADKPISAVSQAAPEFQQQFMQEYYRYTASKVTVNASLPLSPLTTKNQSIYQENAINNLPYYHINQYQETLSGPLKHFPKAEYVHSFPSDIQAPPQPIQINLYHPSSPIAPPIIDKQPERTLKTNDSSIRKSFQRISFPTTHCRILGNHRYVDSPADKTDQRQADELLTTFSQLNIPKKTQRLEPIQNLDVEQVHSQRKLLLNTKLFNAPQNKIDSIIINPTKPSKKQQPSSNRQQPLKFNIQRQFPVPTQSHLKYLSQNQYNFNQSITSNFPANNYSCQESSDYNIPSHSWMYKESLKLTPRMNFSYAYPKVALETPLNNNSYENGNSVFLREEKEVAPVSGGRNIKISLCSPKAAKIRSNDGKVKRNFIKLRSPHHKGDIFHSREKRMSPAFEPNSQFRSNQANSYQINSGASPKKKKLKLVQKTKSPITQVPASAIPQKEISLFEQDNPKAIRVSNQLHREKIKITLKTNPPPKPMEIQSQERVLADQSQILVEYQQNQRPIYARIH